METKNEGPESSDKKIILKLSEIGDAKILKDSELIQIDAKK